MATSTDKKKLEKFTVHQLVQEYMALRKQVKSNKKRSSYPELKDNSNKKNVVIPALQKIRREQFKAHPELVEWAKQACMDKFEVSTVSALLQTSSSVAPLG